MPEQAANCPLNLIFCVGLITFLSQIFALESNNLEFQNYDYVDVARETANGGSKGKTTRIFTTADELDEEFWLKYLGVDFRHATHLEVDGNNNVVHLKDKQPHSQPIEHIANEEKRTRFVRQPLLDNKQLIMESLHLDNKTQYPTEKPEVFNVKQNSSSLEVNLQRHLNNNFNKKLTSRHKQKLLVSNNKHKLNIIRENPSKLLKALSKPLVVNLPDMDNAEHQIYDENEPVVFQIPPVIYHQMPDRYPVKDSNIQYFGHSNNLREAGIRNLALDNYNSELYSNQNQHSPVHNQDHYATEEIPNLSVDSRHTEIYADHAHNTPIQDQHHKHPIHYVPFPHLTLLNNKDQQHKHPVFQTQFIAPQMKRSYPQQKHMFSPGPPTNFPLESINFQPSRLT